MKGTTLAAHATMSRQQAQQLTKKHTGRTCFICPAASGCCVNSSCARLSHTALHRPQQAVLHGLRGTTCLALSKNTKTAKNTARQSETHNVKEKIMYVRLSNRLWWARHDYEKGKNLSFEVRTGSVQFDSSSQRNQTLYEDY